MDIFVSVGTGLNAAQEAFVVAVETRLRAVGLVPHTIGRNTFSTEAPLRAVVELMGRCQGAVVIALERYACREVIDRPGSDREARLEGVRMPTAWNQIEATMAYGKELPLLVIVDERLRQDGLLEKGNDWFVLEVRVDPAALDTPVFNGLLSDWRDRLGKQAKPAKPAPALDPAAMTVGRLVGLLKPAQLWAVLIALAGLAGGAFALGAKLGG